MGAAAGHMVAVAATAVGVVEATADVKIFSPWLSFFPKARLRKHRGPGFFLVCRACSTARR